VVALRIILICVVVYLTIRLCVKFAPKVGRKIIKTWSKLTGDEARKDRRCI